VKEGTKTMYSLRSHTSQYIVHIYLGISNFRVYNGKTVPSQAWSGPGASRKLRFPDYVAMAQDTVKVVSLTHRPLLPPGNSPGTHFC